MEGLNQQEVQLVKKLSCCTVRWQDYRETYVQLVDNTAEQQQMKVTQSEKVKDNGVGQESEKVVDVSNGNGVDNGEKKTNCKFNGRFVCIKEKDAGKLAGKVLFIVSLVEKNLPL